MFGEPRRYNGNYMRTARHTQRSWPHNRGFRPPHSIVSVIAVRRRFLGAQRQYNPHSLITTRALANTRPRVDITRLSAGEALLARRRTQTPLWQLLLVARPNPSAGYRCWRGRMVRAGADGERRRRLSILLRADYTQRGLSLFFECVALSLSRVRSRVRERMAIALAGLTNEP